MAEQPKRRRGRPSNYPDYVMRVYWLEASIPAYATYGRGWMSAAYEAATKKLKENLPDAPVPSYSTVHGWWTNKNGFPWKTPPIDWRDEPWSLAAVMQNLSRNDSTADVPGARRSYIPPAPEAVRDLLELSSRCVMGGVTMTNREAFWAMALRSAVRRHGMTEDDRFSDLRWWSSVYALAERAAELFARPFDSRYLDAYLAFSMWGDEWPLSTSLTAARDMGDIPSYDLGRAIELVSGSRPGAFYSDRARLALRMATWAATPRKELRDAPEKFLLLLQLVRFRLRHDERFADVARDEDAPPEKWPRQIKLLLSSLADAVVKGDMGLMAPGFDYTPVHAQ